MRPDDSVDNESILPAGGGGIMSKYSLAVVCVLGLIAGGTAALALHYARQGTAEVRGVAVKSADFAPEAGTEAGGAGSQIGEGGRAEDGEAWVAGGEAEDGITTSAGKARRSGTGARVRADAVGRAGDGPRAARRYAGGSGVQVASGGRGVAGHALGGVKKTGEGVKKTGAVIGKTFGKIGGVFHD